MTKLSDTQAILLSAAAQRVDGNLLPLPGSLRGGAAVKVVGALLSRGLAREEVTDRTTRADGALNTVWRNEDDGRAVLLKITPEGLAAIGVEAAAEETAEPELTAEPASEPVPYRFNEGTNSAGEPAASTPNATPAEAPKKRGRPKKTTEPAEAPGKRGHPGRRRSSRIRPPSGGPATTPSRRS
jgi:hypothetical protein